MLPGPLETVPDHLKLMLWGRDALLGFLLKGMKDIQDAREAHGVYGSIGVAVEIVDDFQHAPPTKPFQGLGGRVLAAQFRVVDRLADHTADLVRKTRRSSFDDPIHSTVFRRDIRSALDSTTAIPVQASGPKSPMCPPRYPYPVASTGGVP